ncbi:MAG: hypothetical protein AAF502_15655 [Bacteroidota bacterium]
MSSGKFVFVVCGSKGHIHSLQLALRYLSYFSSNEIIVLTDEFRNEIPIKWKNVINIKTPSSLSNHQASIYLKTGLHKFLDPKFQYCYLDSDVLAISSNVDKIFSMNAGPVTFSTDHCKMDRFSPAAVINPQMELDYESGSKIIRDLYFEWKSTYQNSIKFYKRIDEYSKYAFNEINDQKFGVFRDYIYRYFVMAQLIMFDPRFKIKYNQRRVVFSIKYLCSLIVFFGLKWLINREFRFMPLNSESHLVKKGNSKNVLHFLKSIKSYGYEFNFFQQKWKDQAGNEIDKESLTWEYFHENRGYYFDLENDKWSTKEGQLIVEERSDLLRQRIREKFGVNVSNPQWQHWNGGVFLFDNSSHEFLDTWHNYTMEIFKDEKWRVRDQGTLIATAWKHGLQDNPTLPIGMNFLADYYADQIQYKGSFIFDFKEGQKGIKPCFLHIYHHFGDEKWKLWQDVIELGKKEGILPADYKYAS